jgi:HAD superfamily hydrolase (TIGR01509 family)
LAEGSPLVIFDCDGVLVDSEPLANQLLAELLTDAGLPTSAEDSWRDYRGRTQAACGQLAADRLGATLPPDFFDHFDRRFGAACRESLRPVAGIEQALEGLDALGCRVCVASSGSVEKMRFTLELTGLLGHFEDALYSAADLSRSKPWPDIFLHAAGHMGAAPADCVVVEDSRLGVEAAVRAGMPVLGFAAPGEAGILSEAGACAFDDMRELPERVTQIAGLAARWARSAAGGQQASE